MMAAQVQLTNYFVSELQFTANPAFNLTSESTVGIDDLQVANEATPLPNEPKQWQITLRLALNAPPERNSPYTFLLEIIGFVEIADSVSVDRIERFARINGTSLIFSAAREIIKAATSRGPYKALLLPTVTFWEPKKDVDPEAGGASTDRVETPDVKATTPTD